MWLASRTDVFTYFCIFFQAKEFGNQQNEKKSQKNQRRYSEESKRVNNDKGSS